MIHVIACIADQHDWRLVVLAAAVCSFAMWTSVNLMSRARGALFNSRIRWTASAALIFGFGVWATHFIAMLAFLSNLPIAYDINLTLISIVVAIGLAFGAFWLADQRNFSALGGAGLGVAVSAMHYIGMNSLDGPFRLQWDWFYVLGSMVAGIFISSIAVWVGAMLSDIRGRLAETLLLVLGICAMHFTGMSAVTLVSDPTVGFGGNVLAPDMLAITIAAVALLVVSLGLVSAHVDQSRMRQSAAEMRRLETYIAELEATKRQLEITSKELGMAAEKALDASKSKSAFLAAMSHELRTPLNAIIGFSELILSEPFGAIGDARYNGYVRDISKSGSHLLLLINDILDLSRLDAKRIEFASERVSIPEILNQAKQMVEIQARQAHLELKVVVPQKISDIRGDARRLKQVLLNLLSNAIKFTPIGGTVSVTVTEAHDGVVITVADTGIGIAENDIDKAFERFGQVDSRLARRYEGAGLGLPIAKQIVESQGGSLRIQSKLNAGTTVTVRLPRNPIYQADVVPDFKAA